jgi:hypothetical protein
LARVTETEESSSPVTTAGPTISEDPKENGKEKQTQQQTEDLMEVATPQISNKENEGFPGKAESSAKSEGEKIEKEGGDEAGSAVDSEVLGEMKNVAI